MTENYDVEEIASDAELEIRRGPTGEIEYYPGEDSVAIRSAFTDAQLYEVASFDDAVRMAAAVYGEDEIIKSFDLGDGYKKLTDKSLLVDVPFIVVGWGIGMSEYGDTSDIGNVYSIIRVVVDRIDPETGQSEKWRFVDGSAGIHRTLMQKFDGNPVNFRSILALAGLAKPKEYIPRNPDGTPLLDGKGHPVGKALTYRFNTEALTLTRLSQ